MNEQGSSTPVDDLGQQVGQLLTTLLNVVQGVLGIVQKALSALTTNPQLLQEVARPIGEAVLGIGKAVEKTVPELGKTLGSTVGGTVSDVGQTVGQTVGNVSEIGKPLGKTVEGVGQALGGGAGEAKPEEGKRPEEEKKPEQGQNKEDMVKSLHQKLSDEELMKKSIGELEALSKALEARKTA